MSCSSPPEQTRVVPPVNRTQEAIQPLVLSPDDLLDKAQQSYRASGDINLRNLWVLKAADAFAAEQDCISALKVVELIRPELVDNVQQTHANVISGECEIRTPDPDIKRLSHLLMHSANQVGFDKRLAALYVRLYTAERRWLDAARAAIETQWDAQRQNEAVWQLLQNLDVASLESARLRESKLQPWLQLSLIIHRFGLSPEELKRAYDDWRTRFAGTLPVETPPGQITEALALSPIAPQNISVLLPLSGRLAAQGEAIKDGIMAAFFADNATDTFNDEHPQPSITFYDSMRLDESMIQSVSESDFLIGPLLRENIIKVSQQLPANLPTLALNRVPNTTEGNNTRYFFGLLPEDEAVQLAEYVRDKGARYPIVIAHDSPTPSRMAQAFLTTWRNAASDDEPAPGFARFSDNKTMRTSVTEMLDVAQSKSRIQEIESLLDKELHSVPRNRRDIDAIVLFSNAEQTELLNPIIESSLSPFNDKMVSVYASSRSYTLNRSNNSLRDLQNLTFTEMPWMLPDHKWQTLANQTQQLWPDKNDTLRRLFALGYDSYQLLPDLKTLRVLPQLNIGGLSGQLSVTPDGQVLRQLPMGKVNEEQVTLIAVD